MAYGLMRMVRDNNSVFVLVGIVVGLEFGMAWHVVMISREGQYGVLALVNTSMLMAVVLF